MKKISYWAKNHTWPVMIAFSFMIITGLGILSGLLLQELDFFLTRAVLLLIALICCTGFLAYPCKKTVRTGIQLYYRSKACDMLMASTVFLVSFYLGNQPGELFGFSLPVNPAGATSHAVPNDSTLKTYKTIAAFAASMKDGNGNRLKLKARKKLLKEQLRAIRHSGEPSRGGKIALIILSIIVALGLTALAVVLSCSISINGGPAAVSWLLFIGGPVLAGFLLALIWKILVKKKKKATAAG